MDRPPHVRVPSRMKRATEHDVWAALVGLGRGASTSPQASRSARERRRGRPPTRSRTRPGLRGQRRILVQDWSNDSRGAQSIMRTSSTSTTTDEPPRSRTRSARPRATVVLPAPIGPVMTTSCTIRRRVCSLRWRCGTPGCRLRGVSGSSAPGSVPSNAGCAGPRQPRHPSIRGSAAD